MDGQHNSNQNCEPNTKIGMNQRNKNKKSQVSVICRVKPLTTSQSPIDMKIDKENAEIQVIQPRQQTMKTFSFNKIYTDEPQEQFVEECCRQILKNILQDNKGYLIFSYGVTNSGKTHTILGTEKQPGILPYLIKKLSKSNQVHISALQLYNDQFFSLSNRHKIVPKEIGGFLDFSDCQIDQIINPENMQQKFKNYVINRTQNDTKINNKSSRSHAIFRIRVNNKILGVVDLAGSQRTNRVYADIDQTSNINKSLLCLGRCIKALNQNINTPIPYRQSKLTRVLIEYFAAKVQVLMIANISQSQEHFHENMKVLDYAIMAKDIRHCSTINSIMKSTKNKKKAITRTDIFENLSRSIHKSAAKVSHKTLKSSRKIMKEDSHGSYEELEKLKAENQKYLKDIKKQQMMMDLKKLEGSMEALQYLSAIEDQKAEQRERQELEKLQEYTYQSPVRKVQSIHFQKNVKEIGVGPDSQFKRQELNLIKQELLKQIQRQNQQKMVEKQTYITSSFKKFATPQSLQTPVKQKASQQISNQSFIKKSCTSIYDSVKKILSNNISALSMKKIKTDKKSKTKQRLQIYSNFDNMFTYQPILQKQLKSQEEANKRQQFSFKGEQNQKHIEKSDYGVQVDESYFNSIQSTQSIKEDQSQEDEDQMLICPREVSLSIKKNVIVQQQSNEQDVKNLETDYGLSDDNETVANQPEPPSQKQSEKQTKKHQKPKPKKAKQKITKNATRAKRIAQARKIAAQLCRQQSRTPLKKRLRSRNPLHHAQ